MKDITSDEVDEALALSNQIDALVSSLMIHTDDPVAYVLRGGQDLDAWLERGKQRDLDTVAKARKLNTRVVEITAGDLDFTEELDEIENILKGGA